MQSLFSTAVIVGTIPLFLLFWRLSTVPLFPAALQSTHPSVRLFLLLAKHTYTLSPSLTVLYFYFFCKKKNWYAIPMKPSWELYVEPAKLWSSSDSTHFLLRVVVSLPHFPVTLWTNGNRMKILCAFSPSQIFNCFIHHNQNYLVASASNLSCLKLF